MASIAAQVEIDWAGSLADLAGKLARSIGGIPATPLPLVPSTMRADDPVLVELRNALRRDGIRTTGLVPRSALAGLAGRGGDRWREVSLDGRRYRLDARLPAAPWTAVTVIDERSRTGPFVLDLPSRFLHPADRVRLVARPDRDRALADIAAAALPTRCIALTPQSGGWLVMRAVDPVAAELWSLALAERYLDERLEMRGPWEDPTVQRATELELGLRIPGEMYVTIATTSMPPDGVHMIEQAARRLGLGLPAR